MTVIEQDMQTGVCKVWLGDVFCPRLSLEDAKTLANRINNLAKLRGTLQARIRLASYCITAGVNS